MAVPPDPSPDTVPRSLAQADMAPAAACPDARAALRGACSVEPAVPVGASKGRGSMPGFRKTRPDTAFRGSAVPTLLLPRWCMKGSERGKQVGLMLAGLPGLCLGVVGDCSLQISEPSNGSVVSMLVVRVVGCNPCCTSANLVAILLVLCGDKVRI